MLVGYTNDYVVVQNSWGPTWGMNGFIQLGWEGNNGSGQCGFMISASYPLPRKN
jgi:hypothetical protein